MQMGRSPWTDSRPPHQSTSRMCGKLAPAESALGHCPLSWRTVSSGPWNGVTTGRHFAHRRSEDRREGEIVRDESPAGTADGKNAANHPDPGPRPVPLTGELSPREDRMALELHRAVAKKLLDDPAAVLGVVPENIARLRRGRFSVRQRNRD